MKKITLAHLLQPYRGGWVSVSKDYQKVLVSGKTIKSVLAKLASQGNPPGVLMRVAKDYSRYAGTSNTTSN